MSDPRYARLAGVITGHSVGLRRGEHVLVDLYDIPAGMAVAVIRAIRARKAHPHVRLFDGRIVRELALGADGDQVDLAAELDLARMKRMDAYIALRGSGNISELSDVPSAKLQMIGEKMRKVQDHRVRKTKWVVLRWPTPAMAQLAGMSTEAFEDMFFRVCTLDYRSLMAPMRALQRLMERTDHVRIEGPGTDLRFRIKGIPAVPCGGHHNLPDGEVFTAPVRDSVEGHVTFNAPTIYQGTAFDNVRLEFGGGRITRAVANNTRRLNAILDSDEGARHIGEFALGFNPHVRHPMRDILFDEKIAGSFHFTPGQAYEVADNGNRSRVHWDLVSIQRRDYGGGTISFDGKVVRKDGRFLPKSLEKLNG